MTNRNVNKRTCCFSERPALVFLGAFVFLFAAPSHASILNLSQLLQSLQSFSQSDQNQLLDTLAGQLAGTSSNTTDNTTSTATTQNQDIKDLIKEEIKAAEQSFLTTMINLIVSSIEQQFMQVLGLNTLIPTPTPTPTPTP
jgi:hypothetical protein